MKTIVSVIFASLIFISFSGNAADENTKKAPEKVKAEADGSKKMEAAKEEAKKEMKKVSKTMPGKGAKEKKGTPKKMYAVFTLTHGGKPFGQFKALLFHTHTPKTVENFVGLTEGTKEFIEVLEGKKRSPGQKTTRRFYDGVSFHRVIKNFMIQGGDPTGSGRYTPGYNFNDEFVSHLRHNKKGLLSMANPGRPNQNGSQFFITVKDDLKYLDNKHTIFGEVIEGYEVVEKASKIPTDKRDKPLEALVMEKVEIVKEY